MTCPACGSDQHKAKITGDGLRLVCLSPECGRSWDPEASTAPVVTEVEERQLTQRSKPQPKPRIAMAPSDLLKRAKVEIKSLNAEIKRLEALKRQRDELKRLVAAAQQPKRAAVIRALRANGE